MALLLPASGGPNLEAWTRHRTQLPCPKPKASPGLFIGPKQVWPALVPKPGREAHKLPFLHGPSPAPEFFAARAEARARLGPPYCTLYNTPELKPPERPGNKIGPAAAATTLK